MAKKGVMPPSVKPGKPVLTECPPGWERCTYADLFDTIERPVKLHDDSEYQLVTVKRSRGGVVRREVLPGRQIKTKSAYELRAGDFLISNRQIVHGACGTVPPDLDGAIVSGEYTVLGPKNGTSMDYVRHLSHSLYFQQSCYHASIGVDIEKMVFKLDRWLKTPLNCPSTQEQRKIAEILSCWDEGIETAEKVIGKLYTKLCGLRSKIFGRNGFLAAIKPTRCADHFNLVIGGTPSRSSPDLWDPQKVSSNIWLSIRNLNTKFISDSSEYISDLGIQKSNVKLLPAGTVVMSFKLTIGRVGILTVPAYTNEAICGFVPKHSDTVNAEYLFQYLQSIDFTGSGEQAVKGRVLNKEKLGELEIKIPNLGMQTTIGSVMGALDREKSIYESIRDSLIFQKQALMQKLLTGKIRVKV